MATQVTFQGTPLTLTGTPVKQGDTAPEFTAINQDLSDFAFSSLKGHPTIISAVPSLDTPVCSAQTHHFNKAAEQLADDVRIVTISMDLPFAQARWCGTEGVDRITVVSDFRDASFGQAYGQLIKELRLLARAVMLVDRGGTITYIEQVPELTNEPDYDKALAALKQIL